MLSQKALKPLLMLALAFGCFACQCTPWLPECQTVPQIPTGMDIRVAMPDGTQLMTDIYAPAGAGPWPVVLLRTPYDPGDPIHAGRGTEYNALGIVYVVQSSRGLFGSGGTADFFASDKQDGRDMLRVLRSQSWCTGRVAMIGHSAPGIEAYCALPNNTSVAEEFVCSWIEMATPNLQDSVYQGGVFRKALTEQWLNGTGQSSILADVVANATNRSWWDNRRISNDYQSSYLCPLLHVRKHPCLPSRFPCPNVIKKNHIVTREQPGRPRALRFSTGVQTESASRAQLRHHDRQDVVTCSSLLDESCRPCGTQGHMVLLCRGC
ncbi:MAG: CocE/NonD family hydrolase [Planctomycetota bacterium]